MLYKSHFSDENFLQFAISSQSIYLLYLVNTTKKQNDFKGALVIINVKQPVHRLSLL